MVQEWDLVAVPSSEPLCLPLGGWGRDRVAGAESRFHQGEGPVLVLTDQPWRPGAPAGVLAHTLASWRTRWRPSAQAGVLAHRLAS